MREINEKRISFVMTTFSGTVCISDSKMRSYARLRGVHNENLGNKCVTVVSDSRPQLLELPTLSWNRSEPVTT